MVTTTTASNRGSKLRSSWRNREPCRRWTSSTGSMPTKGVYTSRVTTRGNSQEKELSNRHMPWCRAVTRGATSTSIRPRRSEAVLTQGATRRMWESISFSASRRVCSTSRSETAFLTEKVLIRRSGALSPGCTPTSTPTRREEIKMDLKQ
jgi:hypothetical protein